MKRVNYDELDSPDGVTYSWQGQLFTGTSYELRPNGQLWNEMDFVDGQYHGQMRSWSPSGQLEEETTYYNGVTYGPDREWDEAGRLRREAFIEYSFLVREKKWDENGQLIEEFEIAPDDPNYSLLQKFRAVYGADPRLGPLSVEAG